MIDLSYKDIFGNLRKEQETANCYVISVPGDYCFPLIYGCGIMGGKDNKISYTSQGELHQSDFHDYKNEIIKGAEINYKGEKISIIAWDNSREVIRDIRIVKDYIHFCISSIPEDGGNYILALFDNNEKIIWSWHIWLWKDKLKNIDLGKHKLLNINLASHKEFSGRLRNWYYQWGRKDPMCYLDKMINIKEESADCIGQAIQNPRTFFTYDSDYKNNWVKKSFFYNYWNSRCYKECVEEPVDKTIYDPCPPNYTVPGYGVFSKLSKDKWVEDDKKSGWMFKGDVLFPALGCRHSLNGTLYNVGDYGFYWSASAADEYNANQLSLYNHSIGFSSRAFGFPVRPCAIK